MARAGAALPRFVFRLEVVAGGGEFLSWQLQREADYRAAPASVPVLRSLSRPVGGQRVICTRSARRLLAFVTRNWYSPTCSTEPAAGTWPSCSARKPDSVLFELSGIGSC